MSVTGRTNFRPDLTQHNTLETRSFARWWHAHLARDFHERNPSRTFANGPEPSLRLDSVCIASYDSLWLAFTQKFGAAFVNNRVAIGLILFAAMVLLAGGCTQTGKTTKPMTNSENNSGNDPLSIHRRAIIIDMHADTTQR